MNNFIDVKVNKLRKLPTSNDKNNFVMKIPYIGPQSIEFKKKIVKIFKNHFDCDLVCVYNSFKVQNYFCLKDITPMSLMSNVVYKFSCLRDADNFYLGKTKRHLCTRVEEHLNNKMKSKSAISQHIFDCFQCKNSNLNINSFQIVKKCNSDFSCQINEALLIKKFKPKMNNQLFNSGQSFILNIFN